MPAHRLRSGQPVEITTVAERPHLAHADIDVGTWPEFMRHNRIAETYFGQTVETFGTTCLIATVDGVPIADAHAVQLSYAGRPAFPSGGWEQVVVWAFADARRGVRADATCALNISVARDFQTQGAAALMLSALRQAVASVGLGILDAPVRPTHKQFQPRTPMTTYASRMRADGLPVDPWLRTHVGAGGQVESVAAASWVVAGSLDEWRSWTGLAFDRSGLVEVPGGLVPVECDVAADRAVYVEPNVWVRHRFSTA
ncbi:N-acetyltransferase [Kribbella sp. NPDC026611]|uniref:N-acetyltransferase n=1 Tax=Kribbella sp. NPDC026611 TaxID=3154911 RepID=UPI00340B4E71